MPLSARAQQAWDAFVLAVNPAVLHPLDEKRLYRFVALRYLDGGDFDHEAALREFIDAGPTRDRVLRLIDIAPSLYDALVAAAGED
jgi:hypothetical protein